MKIKTIFFLVLLNLNITLAEASEMDQGKIYKNLRCLICQGQSIYDSDSAFANSIKVLIDKKLNEGFSENEIYSFFKDKYGEWILYDPQLNKNTYLLWLLPLLIFIIGGAIIFKTVIIKNN